MTSATGADADPCAVRRDTDLRRHAHLLHRMHDAMLDGAPSPGPPRGVVQRSWHRMRAAGHDADRIGRVEPADRRSVEERRRRTPLAMVIDGLRDSLVSVADQAGYLMMVTDAEGMVLWRAGSPLIRRRADAVGFADGVRWTEQTAGTNAIGTALVEQTPVQLFSAEHYTRPLHGWTCTACPLHDPRTGALLGVVNLSGEARDAHPETVALVRTAVRFAEAELWRRRETGLNALRAVAGSTLVRAGGPALLVDADGWVASVNGIATTGRVAAPAAGHPVVVPGVGRCLPEPVAGGWLLRPEPGGAGGALRLRLDRSAVPAQAVLDGGPGPAWRYPLSPRHHQLLVSLMAAGPSGLTAAALSTAVYGEAGHDIAVRAEMSRLRRRLGGVVLTRPYRISPDVVVDPA
ncbi:GAF domain-containing protein [Nakamurella sp.]|uniref:helix-turn-helix domain-containing protein n=1 Tax=Nakamurella sp. TaxID=1869182 RepID=UPI003B3A3020